MGILSGGFHETPVLFRKGGRAGSKNDPAKRAERARVHVLERHVHAFHAQAADDFPDDAFERQVGAVHDVSIL